MKAKKFQGHIITDVYPKAGDTLICVQKKNVNYGKTSVATKQNVDLMVLDTTNWKVVVPKEVQDKVEAAIKEAKCVQKAINTSSTYWHLSDCLNSLFSDHKPFKSYSFEEKEIAKSLVK